VFIGDRLLQDQGYPHTQVVHELLYMYCVAFLSSVSHKFMYATFWKIVRQSRELETRTLKLDKYCSTLVLVVVQALTWTCWSLHWQCSTAASCLEFFLSVFDESSTLFAGLDLGRRRLPGRVAGGAQQRRHRGAHLLQRCVFDFALMWLTFCSGARGFPKLDAYSLRHIWVLNSRLIAALTCFSGTCQGSVWLTFFSGARGSKA